MPVTWYEACWAKGAGWVFGIENTVAMRWEKSAGIRCCVSAAVEAVSTWPGSHSVRLSRFFPDYFLFEDRGGQRVLPGRVFMPQLAADVSVQRKFGPKEGTWQDCSGSRHLLNPDRRRFSSGPQKPSLHLPLWHDVDTMSDSSPWTTLSNFNVPHFFSGARLRRSKRYHLKPKMLPYFLFLTRLYFMHLGCIDRWKQSLSVRVTTVMISCVYSLLSEPLHEVNMNEEMGVPFFSIVYYLLCESNDNWMFVVEAISGSSHRMYSFQLPSHMSGTAKVEMLIVVFIFPSLFVVVTVHQNRKRFLSCGGEVLPLEKSWDCIE